MRAYHASSQIRKPIPFLGILTTSATTAPVYVHALAAEFFKLILGGLVKSFTIKHTSRAHGTIIDPVLGRVEGRLQEMETLSMHHMPRRCPWAVLDSETLQCPPKCITFWTTNAADAAVSIINFRLAEVAAKYMEGGNNWEWRKDESQIQLWMSII